MGEKTGRTLVSFKNYGPPDLYVRRVPHSKVVPSGKPGDKIISIVGIPKDHLEYYAWRGELIIIHTYFGCCQLSKPETFFRLIARFKNSAKGQHLVTPYIIKRIWGKVQTEDGAIYTLGTEVKAVEITGLY